MQNLSKYNNQFDSKDLFEAFKLQLMKDFEQSNFPADFVKSIEPDYDRIRETIATELQRGKNKADYNIMQLLYRIDIGEAQLNRYLTKNKKENYYHVIAELIIKRVLQKVVIKRHYKINESS